jgi:hypothetical protein
MDETEQAQEDVSLAIKLEPDGAHFYRIRGNWRREDNDLEGALEDYCTAISLQPGIAVHYFCRGLVYKDQKVKSTFCGREVGGRRGEGSGRRRNVEPPDN